MEEDILREGICSHFHSPSGGITQITQTCLCAVPVIMQPRAQGSFLPSQPSDEDEDSLSAATCRYLSRSSKLEPIRKTNFRITCQHDEKVKRSTNTVSTAVANPFEAALLSFSSLALSLSCALRSTFSWKHNAAALITSLIGQYTC